MISISKIPHLTPKELDPFRRKFDTPTLSKITLVARTRKSAIDSTYKKNYCRTCFANGACTSAIETRKLSS